MSSDLKLSVALASVHVMDSVIGIGTTVALGFITSLGVDPADLVPTD